MHDVVDNLRRVIEGARERGIPVLFGPMAYTEEDYAAHELHRRSGINRVMFEKRMFLAGSWGADFHPDLRPAPDEIVLRPHKGVDVFETDLPEHLQRLGTTQLGIVVDHLHRGHAWRRPKGTRACRSVVPDWLDALRSPDRPRLTSAVKSNSFGLT